MTGLALVAVAMAQAQTTITVQLEDTHLVSFAVLAEAKTTAARIYADIGVKLVWCIGGEAALSMQFDSRVPSQITSDAVGYALPYGVGRTRIHILYERAVASRPRWLAGRVLGHVMAHELGHVLEGFNRHAPSGVMKARWDSADLDHMLHGPLAFGESDAQWIRKGLLQLR